MTIGVLIAADQPVVRRAVRLALEAENCQIVAECPAGLTAVELARSTNPDVVVLGWSQHDQSGFDLLHLIRQAAPDVRIIVRSSRPAASAQPVIDGGADQYVDTNDLAALVEAVVHPTPAPTVEGIAVEVRPAGARSHAVDDRAAPYRVLVVDDDVTARRLLRLSLELEGAEVSEAASLAEARSRLGQHIDGVVLDRRLPDGDGLDLLPLLAERYPQACVVVCSNLEDHAEPWFVLHVPKTDMESVVSALGLARREQPGMPMELRLGASLAEIVRRWIARLARQLTDPPTKSAHVLMTQLVHALGPEGALGPDDEAGDERDARQRAEVTVRQLVDLRELITAEVGRQLNREGRAGLLEVVNREIDIWILAVVGRDVERLRQQAATDALTGLLNRRAFDEALTQEVERASRYRRPFSVAMVDLDGLKTINDRDGHPAGDAALVALATAIRGSLRASDRAYRVGGDEFVILLPETPKRLIPSIIERIEAGGGPAFSWGAATYLEDTIDSETVIDLADRALLARRRASRS
ncbi:MAG: diguanylate cyclase [Acidimicrobiales bacterium]